MFIIDTLDNCNAPSHLHARRLPIRLEFKLNGDLYLPGVAIMHFTDIVSLAIKGVSIESWIWGGDMEMSKDTFLLPVINTILHLT